MNANRSGGYAGSSGRYAPPAFRTASSPTIISGERSMARPTSTSGPTPTRAQVVGQLIRPPVQLGVGEPLSLRKHSDGIRRPFRLRLHELMQAARGLNLPRGLVPVAQRPAGVRPRRATAACEIRWSGLAMTPSNKVRKCPRIRTLVARSNNCVSLHKSAVQLRPLLGDHEGQIHFRRMMPCVDVRNLQRLHDGTLIPETEEVEQGVEHGRRLDVARPPQLARQRFERNFLVRVDLENHFAHAGHQIAKRRIVRQARAVKRRVDEEADQPLHLIACASGLRGGDDDVAVPGVAVQEDVEGCQQRHEQRDAFAAAEAAQRARRRLGQRDRLA